MGQSCQPEVIYGDTDSIFIKFPGLTISEAYEASQKMIKHITLSNPYPMELKYEKVYRPMINMAKKRYSGYKYETPTSQPEIESKGIETIRRDFLPIVTKIMNKVLHLLFIENDVSLVKKYFEKQWAKLHEGNVEAFDLFLKPKKSKDIHSTYVLPDKKELICQSKKQLTNTLNRIFHIIGTDINDWVRNMNERNTLDALFNERRSLGIMNKTKDFDSKSLLKLGFHKNTELSKFTLSSPYLVLENDFTITNSKDQYSLQKTS